MEAIRYVDYVKCQACPIRSHDVTCAHASAMCVQKYKVQRMEQLSGKLLHGLRHCLEHKKVAQHINVNCLHTCTLPDSGYRPKYHVICTICDGYPAHFRSAGNYQAIFSAVTSNSMKLDPGLVCV